MPSFIIFSIEGVSDVHTQAKFLRHIDTLKSMGKMSGKMIPCIGMYKGVLEPSYLVSSEDFFDHIATPNGYVSGQESFLQIDVGHRGQQVASLLYIDTGLTPLGRISSVSKEEALKRDAWTYRMDTNTYFVTEF
jgi:hypothetical protein